MPCPRITGVTLCVKFDNDGGKRTALVQVTERFVWGKKIEKQIAEGVSLKELSAKAEQKRMQERMVSCSVLHPHGPDLWF